MPRKKKAGNRGESPEKSYPPFSGIDTHSIPTGASFPNYNVPPANVMGSQANASSWVDVAKHGIGESHSPTAISEHDQTFFRLQEMFKGKLEPDVIHMVLVESQWKVNEALEKLFMLTSESECERESLEKQASMMYPKQNPSYDPNLKSRLPSRISLESSSGQLPMLSPKTPSDIGPGYPDVFVSSSPVVNPGLQALDSYGSRMPFQPTSAYGGQQPYISQASVQPSVHPNKTPGSVMFGPFSRPPYSASEGMTSNRGNPTEQQPSKFQSVSSSKSQNVPYKYVADNPQPSCFAQTVLSTSTTTSQGIDLRYTHIPETHVATGKPKNSDSSTLPLKEASRMGSTHNEQKNIAKKRGRKTTMSLNPEEREALENLIEDVIIGGIGEGVIDSEESASSSTECDDDCKTQTEASSSDVPKEDDSSKSDGKSDSGEKKNKDSAKIKQSKDPKKDGQKGLEQGQKVYPPQLKVAVKHMKNLPPRFLRKIQTNKDDKSDMDPDGKPKRMREKPIPEVVEPKETKPYRPEILPRKKEEPALLAKEKMRSKEEQMIEKKRRVRGMLLEGLDSYLEQSVDSDEKKQDDSTPTREGGLTVTKAVHTETLSHSAPSSAQVSPNSNLILHQKTPSVDLNQINQDDPAIKAQGPTIGHQIRPIMQVPVSRIQQPRIMGGQQGGQIAMPRPPIYLQPNAVNCEELEREMFNKSGESHPDQRLTIPPPPQSGVASQQTSSVAGLNVGMQQMSLAQLASHSPLPPHQQQQLLQQQHSALQQHARSQFSVDAPEFIPRAFTPGTLSKLGYPPDMMVTQNPPPQVPPHSVAQHSIHQQPHSTHQQPHSAHQQPHSAHQQPHSAHQQPHSAHQQPQNLLQQQQNALQQHHNALQSQNTLQQPPSAVPASSNMGRASPNIQNVSTVASSAMLTQDQLVSVSGQHQMMGRNSPIPAVQTGGPAYILPKVAPPNMPNVHAGVVPQGAPGVGLMYAPMPAPYPQQFPGAGYPASYHQLQGPFLVQAWSGGRKNHTQQQFHPSHPASRQKPTSGMVHKGRSESSGKTHPLSASKLPHRNQHEMTPQQAKEKVQTVMKQGKKVMAILRGLPGSGKSTIAREIQLNGNVYSTDDFFMRGDVFEYDFAKIPEAHEWNQKRAKEGVEKGVSPIVIDNTNTQAWEMRAYVSLALRYDYHIEIIEPSTAWKFKVKELAEKNVHSVPVETIERMLERYDKTMSIEKIMGQVDKKKEESEKQAGQADDPDPDRKTPRRKRRRRRRRKKKTSTEANSDSDKAEDERSSDEEGLGLKKEPLILSALSTDTTENEQERSVLNRTHSSQSGVESCPVPRIHGNKISSSSMDSEDLAAVLMSHAPFDRGFTEQDVIFDPPEAEDKESQDQDDLIGQDVWTREDKLTGQDEVTGEDGLTGHLGNRGGGSACVLHGDRGSGLEAKTLVEETGSTDSFLSAGSVTGLQGDTGQDNHSVLCDGEESKLKTEGKVEDTDVDVDRRDVVIGNTDSLGEGSEKTGEVSEALHDGSKIGTKAAQNPNVTVDSLVADGNSVSQKINLIPENTGTSLIEEKSVSVNNDTVIKEMNRLRNVVNTELENYIREEIVETWINEEINKLTVGVRTLNNKKNGYSVGCYSESLFTTDSSEKQDIAEDCGIAGEKGDCSDIKAKEGMEQEKDETSKSDIEPGVGKGRESARMGEKMEGSAEVNVEAICEGNEGVVGECGEWAVGQIGDDTGSGVYTECMDTKATHDQQPERDGSNIETSYWSKDTTGDRYLVGDQLIAQTGSGRSAGEVDCPEGHTASHHDTQAKETGSKESSLTTEPKEQRTPKRKVKEACLPDPWAPSCTEGSDAVMESFKEKLDPVMKPLHVLSHPVFPASVAVATQTTAADFSAIHKLLRGSHDPELLREFCMILSGQKRELNPNLSGPSSHELSNSRQEASPSRTVKLMLHKGCTTEAEERKEGSHFLRACFPQVPADDLDDILQKCGGDTEWAVNILLDSGYVYCDPATTQTEEGTMTIEGVAEEISSLDNKGSHVSHDSNKSSTRSIVPESVLNADSSLNGNNQSSSLDVSVKTNNSVVNPSLDESEADETSPPPLFLLCHKFINRDLDRTLMEEVSRQRTKRASFLERLERGNLGRPVVVLGDESRESCDEPPTQGRCYEDGQTSSALDNLKEYVDSDGIEGLKMRSEVLPSGPQTEEQSRSCDEGTRDRETTTGSVDIAETGSERALLLHLTPDLAAELIRHFGPVGFHISPESLSDEDLQVALSPAVARQIHGLWARSLLQHFTEEEAAIEAIRRDEEFARQLQAEEDLAYSGRLPPDGSTELPGNKTVGRRGPPVVGLGGGLGALPPSPVRKPGLSGLPPSPVKVPTPGLKDSPCLKEIMEEETAIELSKRDYEQQEFGELEQKLSTKLKRQKLHQLYPEIDATALDDIFNANGYSLEASVWLIDEGLGQKQPVQTVMTAEEEARWEEQLVQQALKASQEEADWLGLDAPDGACLSSEFQTFEDPTYQNYRAEASQHYRQRHECFQKAQDAYKRGMKAVAAFYSQQGHIHTEKLKEANKRAAEKIMESRNQRSSDGLTIDLHGLHVDEALHVLQEKIHAQEAELRTRRDKRLQHLSVVTGQGKHSRGGQARIKPAVMEFLRSRRYRFQEMQAGLLRVDLK